MLSFKRQIYKLSQFEVKPSNPPTVADNSAEYNLGVFNFNITHFTKNFLDLDSDSFELTRIRTLPSVGDLKYEGEPAYEGLVFNLDNVPNLTYELPSNHMVTKEGYCRFEDDITNIIIEKEGEGYELVGLGEGEIRFEKRIRTSITNETNIYAFFDSTSMNIVDATAAKEALKEWFEAHQQESETYTGELYIIPINAENWLNFPNIVLRGSSSHVGQANQEFTQLAELPPNFETSNNSVNPEWEVPRDVVVLAFIDEVDSGDSVSGTAYHRNNSSYGFSQQPTTQYLTDYKNFQEIKEEFNYFRGVVYPIPDITASNYNNKGNAMVLQAFGAIEGGPNYTLQEIEALGVRYALQRRFHWYLNSSNPNYTGTRVNVANPYSPEYESEVPGTDYNLEGLNNFGWVGVYDKDQPASEVFSADSFDADLNRYLRGTTDETIEEVTVEGECFEMNDICFDFQTSDNSEYQLFSNVATFCLTDIQTEENIQDNTAPSVDSSVAEYHMNRYQFETYNFTTGFEDGEDDFYKNTRINTSFITSKGINLEGIEYNGTEITYPFTFDLDNVNNLTYEIEDKHYYVNGRLIKYKETLETSIETLEQEGYSLLSNSGTELTFNRLSTGTSTVEIETIEGKDIGEGNICLSFQTSDDSYYQLFSNEAYFCLEPQNNNIPPTVEGTKVKMTSHEFTFEEEQFTNNFKDPDGNSPKTVRIERNIRFVNEEITEPITGTLKYKDLERVTPYSFKLEDVNDLKYEINERYVVKDGEFYSFDRSYIDIITSYQVEGYDLITDSGGVLVFEKDDDTRYVVGNNVTTEEAYIEFSVSDDSEVPLFSNSARVLIDVPFAETPVEFNLPPTVGDKEIDL